jgi:hypothetical protein
MALVKYDSEGYGLEEGYRGSKVYIGPCSWDSESQPHPGIHFVPSNQPSHYLRMESTNEND